MGIYDREYYRDEPRGLSFGGDWSAVTTIIVINAVIAVIGFFLPLEINPWTRQGQTWITQHLALQGDLFQQPWNAWQLLTYGFVHDPNSVIHVLFNMFALFVFGRDVEGIYGRREFFKLYLSLLILAGLFYVTLSALTAPADDPLNPVIGASGGVMGVAVIFACNFPKRLLYIWGVLPVPAWLLVGLYVLLDFLGTRDERSQTAHWVHIGGAAFGFLYYRTRWNLFRLWPSRLASKVNWKIKLPGRGPKLRVHREEDEPAAENDYLTTGRLQKRVDELLEKISRSGEASLTDEERQFLADASRRYQQRRR